MGNILCGMLTGRLESVVVLQHYVAGAMSEVSTVPNALST
jgi:hypothetical protein